MFYGCLFYCRNLNQNNGNIAYSCGYKVLKNRISSTITSVHSQESRDILYNKAQSVSFVEFHKPASLGWLYCHWIHMRVCECVADCVCVRLLCFLFTQYNDAIIPLMLQPLYKNHRHNDDPCCIWIKIIRWMTGTDVGPVFLKIDEAWGETIFLFSTFYFTFPFITRGVSGWRGKEGRRGERLVEEGERDMAEW